MVDFTVARERNSFHMAACTQPSIAKTTTTLRRTHLGTNPLLALYYYITCEGIVNGFFLVSQHFFRISSAFGKKLVSRVITG
jgi:hypothetical protein